MNLNTMWQSASRVADESVTIITIWKSMHNFWYLPNIMG
jgi:hypothetical protein